MNSAAPTRNPEEKGENPIADQLKHTRELLRFREEQMFALAKELSSANDKSQTVLLLPRRVGLC